jgi:hypothetical protein
VTADERLALIRAKTDRAKKHITDLVAELRAFRDVKPLAIGTKRNPQTRQLIYYVTSIQETPPSIPGILGDILQNLRSALDHLAYQLVLVGTGSAATDAHVYFPIADDIARYENAKRSGQLKGMRPAAVSAIDAVRPYKGGNDTLWRLHRLNNIDKHRVVILAIGAGFEGFDVGAHLQRQLERSQPDFASKVRGAFPPMFLKPADRQFPLKGGDELFIDGPDAEPNPAMQFRFDVAFGEPGIVEGEPLLRTVQEMAREVDEIVARFGPLLA